jgi:hypothetical protein
MRDDLRIEERLKVRSEPVGPVYRLVSTSRIGHVLLRHRPPQYPPWLADIGKGAPLGHVWDTLSIRKRGRDYESPAAAGLPLEATTGIEPAAGRGPAQRAAKPLTPVSPCGTPSCRIHLGTRPLRVPKSRLILPYSVVSFRRSEGSTSPLPQVFSGPTRPRRCCLPCRRSWAQVSHFERLGHGS